jgi:sensor domain CHASE-containing protein
MTLRVKTLLFVGSTLAALILILSIVSSRILGDGFAGVERREAEENVQRAVDAYVDEVQKVDYTVQDWAEWDQSYAFVADRNATFTRENLSDGAIDRMRLDLLAYADRAGAIVFGTGFDFANDVPRPLPPDVAPLLAPDGSLGRAGATSRPVSGVVLLSEGAAMVSARPILTSQAEGPSRGTLVMGRYLDQTMVARLAERTHFALTLHRLDDPRLPADVVAVRGALSATDAIEVRTLDEQMLAGYALLHDLTGAPALVLRVDLPRPVYAESRYVLRYIVAALLVVGLTFLGLALLLLESLTLGPLARLSAGVAAIGASRDRSRRLAVTGHDELATLATTINQALEDLEGSRRREEQLQHEVVQLRVEIDQAKRARAVADITTAEYFQGLRERASSFRRSRQSDEDAPDPARSGEPADEQSAGG